MPPNLRCVAAQAWRSIGSPRNFSSWPGCNESVEASELGRRVGAVFLGGVFGHITLHSYVTDAQRSLEKMRSDFKEHYGPVEDLVSSAKILLIILKPAILN